MSKLYLGTVLLLLAGCDTLLEGQYKGYQPETPTGRWWPEAGDASQPQQPQEAGYHVAPASQPTF